MGDLDLGGTAVGYRRNTEDTDCQAEFPGPAEEGEEHKAGSRLAGAVCRVSYARKPLERCVMCMKGRELATGSVGVGWFAPGRVRRYLVVDSGPTYSDHLWLPIISIVGCCDGDQAYSA
jgi:hypothetical protein